MTSAFLVKSFVAEYNKGEGSERKTTQKYTYQGLIGQYKNN